MKLEALIKAWREEDEALENNLKVNHDLLKEASIHKVKSLIAEYKWSSIIEVIVNILFMGFLVDFVEANWPAIKFAGPAIVLLIYISGDLAFNIYKLVLFGQINAEAPVIRTQKVLHQLKIYSIWEKNSLYVGIPVFALSFFIVIAKAWFDYDLYELGVWLAMFAGGSFIVALVVIWLLKRFPDKNLERAVAFLDEISEFEETAEEAPD